MTHLTWQLHSSQSIDSKLEAGTSSKSEQEMLLAGEHSVVYFKFKQRLGLKMCRRSLPQSIQQLAEWLSAGVRLTTMVPLSASTRFSFTIKRQQAGMKTFLTVTDQNLHSWLDYSVFYQCLFLDKLMDTHSEI